jgi:haloalkane dehalogenase
LRDIPALLIWGMKDPSFPETALQRFETILPHHETIRLPDVGHFVQEELKGELATLLNRFMVNSVNERVHAPISEALLDQAV